MSASKTSSTYSPTILLVEDDRSCRNILRRKFHENTSLGVVLAKDLNEGIALSQSVRFDALVTDLYFDEGKDAPESEVYDGIDLAEAITKERPQLSTYVLSFMSDDPAYHDRAKAKGLQVKKWLFKDALQVDRPESPWRVIETDLLREHLGTLSEADKDHDSVTSLALRLRRPIRTYIQDLPNSRFKVSKPIEVICTLDEDLAKATAPGLGLLQDGFGESIEDALLDLATHIQIHFEELTRSDVQAVDYAAVLRDRLKEFVVEVPNAE